MKSEVLKPTCVGCLKPISKPSQADMAMLRVGLPAHLNCLRIWERIEQVIKRKTR